MDIRTVVSVEVAGPEGLHGCVDRDRDVYLPLVPRREGDKQGELTTIEDSDMPLICTTDMFVKCFESLGYTTVLSLMGSMMVFHARIWYALITRAR